MNLANDLPMSHKRKLSYESLPKTLISDGQPSKIPKVDIGNATQDSGSSKPLTFSDASASGTFANTAFSQAAFHRYPLTEQNLRQFNKSNKAIESTPDNKSRKTQTTTTFTSEGFHTVFRGLEYNHIYIDKRDAKARGADLIQKARAIIKGERHSALKKEQAQALQEAGRKHEDDNELTFLVDVWSKFLSIEDTGLVISSVDDQLEDEEEAIRWIEAAWEKDHLKGNWKTKFTRGSVPPLDIRDPSLQWLADYAPRVKNPKPTLTYGLQRNAFTIDEQHINNKHGAALSSNMDHPFFIVEAYSVEESPRKAEHRCAPSGAAMVRLKRKFDSLAEGTYVDEEAKHEQDERGDHRADKIPIDYFRTDTKSFAFSLIINPGQSIIFVHWAEEAFSKAGQLLTINWHAHYVTHYFLHDVAPWIELHRDIDNVLDWGVSSRKQEIKDLCIQIYAREGGKKSGEL